jgi:uncharacterized OB-fold protein
MANPQRKIPAPIQSPENEAFWKAAAAGRFMVPRCTACGKSHWYPRAICPFCMSDKIELKEASGRGRIYTYSVMRRAPEPYAIGYVTLEEGPSMLTNFVDCDLDKLKVGQAVKLVLTPTEGGPPVPTFTPA